MMILRPAISGQQSRVDVGKASKEEDRSRKGSLRAISSLFSVVLRLDLSGIRWMDDSSVHTLQKNEHIQGRCTFVYMGFFPLICVKAAGVSPGTEETKSHQICTM